jgi:O-antigen/teichoic acid export membrane protein
MTLKHRTFSAGRWTTMSAIGRSALQIAQVAIVARFLTPADFGLMAIAMALLAVVSLLGDFGISRGIIHFDHVDSRTLSSLYWLNLLFAAAVSVCLITAAPLISQLYGQPSLAPVLMWIAPVMLLTAAGQQFNVLAEKELQFAIPAQNEILSSAVGLIVCVIAAVWMHAGVYALVAAALSTAFVGSLLAWLRLSHAHRPTLHCSLDESRPFLRFGSYLVGENVASTLARQADVFVGGWILNSAILGLYSLPRDLSLRLAMMINQVATRVGFPVMSRARHDTALLKEIYLKTLRMTSSVNFPIYVAVGVFADEVVDLLYGPRWHGAADLLRMFAVWGLLRSVGNPVGSLLYAVGMARRAFWWNIAQLFLLPVAYWLGVSTFGVVGLATALIATQLLLLIPTWRLLVYPCCGARFIEYMRQIAIPFAATAGAGAIACAGTRTLEHGTIRLAVGVLLGGFTYLAASAVINRSWLVAMRELIHASRSVRSP